MSAQILDAVKQQFPGAALPAIPAAQKIDKSKQVLLATNGDLREVANRTCWEVQNDFEQRLNKALKERLGFETVRVHPFKNDKEHGFIGNQREGSDAFLACDEEAPIIVLLTSWQYSHHIAPSLAKHKGPILILANFDGTWPGLVGALNLCGSLTGLGRDYARLWSQNFDDDFFYEKLEEFIKTGKVTHDISHLQQIDANHPAIKSEAGQYGALVGEYILRRKEIMGLFDNFCMGMLNGVFPQKALSDIGIPMEGLSQSSLLYEMSLVPDGMREECLQWYIDRGMQFDFGSEDAVDLTREQVKEQCAMMIAMARVADRFGLSAVGVQYQQGLKDSCAASDFAEGAIGSTERYPIIGDDGEVIRPGKPIPCINEVDMGTGIPQIMLFRLLDSLGLNSETTLHDIRWGSEYEGEFYWDFEISGNVPFSHLKGGIAGATGYRQPAMYFAKGGSTISGQCKAGTFIWARAHYEGTEVHMHIGTGDAVELPKAEFQRRLDSTTAVWPLMNVKLHGLGRDELMAAHESNHITVAYVPEDKLEFVTRAYAAMALTQGMQVHIAGTARI